MNAEFLRDHGGISDPWSYVRTGRFVMPQATQDAIAYDGYLDRGYQPWDASRSCWS